MVATVHALNQGHPFSDSGRSEEVARTSSKCAINNLVRSMRIPLAAVVGFLALAGQSLLARNPELPVALHQHRGAVLSILAQPRPHLEEGVPTEAEALTAWEGKIFPPGHPNLVAQANGYGILRVEQEGRISYMVVQLGPQGEILHAFQAGHDLKGAEGLLDTALTDDFGSADQATLAAK